jgi:hypothetical protein
MSSSSKTPLLESNDDVVNLVYCDCSGSMAGLNAEIASFMFSLMWEHLLTLPHLSLALFESSQHVLAGPLAPEDPGDDGAVHKEDLMNFTELWCALLDEKQRNAIKTGAVKKDDAVRAIAEKWHGGTRLWETVLEDVKALRVKPAFADKPITVIVISDGQDTCSKKPFNGAEGARQLLKVLNGMSPPVDVQFNITAVGNVPTDVSAVFEAVSGLTGGVHTTQPSVASAKAKASAFKVELEKTIAVNATERKRIMIKKKTEYNHRVSIGVALDPEGPWGPNAVRGIEMKRKEQSENKKKELDRITSTPLNQLAVDDVCVVLEAGGFDDSVVDIFRRHKMNGSACATLTSAEMKEDLGITELGTRKNILEIFAKHTRSTHPTCFRRVCCVESRWAHSSLPSRT